ncbi:hypothetical protein DCO44_09405 [Acinetobacter sp. AM]|uniref:hypothetical protein n=1 Tax=Acinetobacter sp. AM TaxID=2170730 RepID=UPI000DE6F7D8|nr:hypothetical protein [Acinetobacter sp. AM]PWB14341.1 hypothetical protein DCO44_09405 [Acinetobacter sp. AM]
MIDEYKKKIGLPESHTFKIVSSQWSQRKGQDTDTYECEELNEQGEVIAKYTVKDSTSMYPPFGRSITWTQSTVLNT